MCERVHACKVNYPWNASNDITIHKLRRCSGFLPSLLSIIPMVRIILPHCFHLHFKCFYKCVKRLIHYVGIWSSNESVRTVHLLVACFEMYEKLPSTKFYIYFVLKHCFLLCDTLCTLSINLGVFG